jgi:uncharacterized repeat protein (TIGR01451 family)
VTLAAGGSVVVRFRAPISAGPSPIDNTVVANSSLVGFPVAGLSSDADTTAAGTFTSPLAQPQDVDSPAQTNPTRVTLVAPNADLVVTKSQPSPAVVSPGGTITYTVTVTNNGPATATNVVVTDTLPTGTTFGNVTTTPNVLIGTPTPSGGVLTLNSTNTSTLGSLANGASQTFTITVTAP